jgi:hypothetical protein
VNEEAVLRLAEPFEAFFFCGIARRARLRARLPDHERKGRNDRKDRKDFFHAVAQKVNRADS